MPSNLVIVYHRQPYEEVVEDGKIVFKENKSPNGIVPTLKSFFGRFESGAWVAWKEAEDVSNPDFERVVEIELNKAEQKMFDKSVDSVKGLCEACIGIAPQLDK